MSTVTPSPRKRTAPPPPPLSKVLNFHPKTTPFCLGTCKKPSSPIPFRRRHKCANKLSLTSRARATQVLETGAALFQADAPLRHCLEQLAPLMLCVRDHQGQVERLVRLWWRRIVDEREGAYWGEMLGVFKDMGCLEDLEGGGEGGEGVEEDDDDDEERQGRRYGSASASTSPSTSTSTSTSTSRVPSTMNSPLSLSRASLTSTRHLSSTSTSSASSSGTETSAPPSIASSLLSRLRLTPQRSKHISARRISSSSIDKSKSKSKSHSRSRFDKKKHEHKKPLPIPLSRALVAKIHGLGPNHVLPRLHVQGECGICLISFGEHLPSPGNSNPNPGALTMFTTSKSSSASDTLAPNNQNQKTKANSESEPKETENKTQSQSQTHSHSHSKDQDPDRPVQEYDFSRWVWCKGNCGTSYHKECLNQWIDTLRYARDPHTPSWPTCPTCRVGWVY